MSAEYGMVQNLNENQGISMNQSEEYSNLQILGEERRGMQRQLQPKAMKLFYQENLVPVMMEVCA